MSLFQSPTGKRRTTPSNPVHSGNVHIATFTYVFDSAFAFATDKIELGLLAADCKVVGATVIGEGLGVNVADVGFMSGNPGDIDDTRTVGSEFFSGQSVNDTEADAAALVCKDIATDINHRAIGVTLSADVAAGAAKKISLVLHYQK